MQKIEPLNTKMNTYGLKLINLSNVSAMSKYLSNCSLVNTHHMVVFYNMEKDYVTGLMLSEQSYQELKEVYAQEEDFVCFLHNEVPSSYIATRVALKIKQVEPWRALPTTLITEVMWDYMDTEWVKKYGTLYNL